MFGKNFDIKYKEGSDDIAYLLAQSFGDSFKHLPSQLQQKVISRDLTIIKRMFINFNKDITPLSTYTTKQ